MLLLFGTVPERASSADAMTQGAPTTAVEARAGRRMGLLRVLGVGFGVAVTIGNTIGAGILRTPGEIAANLPVPWLYLGIWVLGALYALMCAVSVAELATMIPRSGGHYVFAREALGDYAGFLIGWSDWLSIAGTNSLVAIVIGEYSAMLFPALVRHQASVACGVVLFFTAIQWRGIRWGAGVQNFSSAIKSLLFVALAVACFAYARPVAATAPAPALATGFSLVTAFVLAMQAAVFTYDGWQGVIYFGEEIKNPARDVPRSMFGGVLSVMAIYLLLNVAVLHVVPMSKLAGDKLALGTAAAAIWGTRADTIIQVVTIISLLAAVNAVQLEGCRVMFAMSRDGLFARMGGHVNRGGTPDVGLALSTVAEVLFIVTGTVQQVLAALALFFVTNYIVDFIAVFVLRRRQPERPRAYRAWGYPYTTALVLAVSIAFIIGVAISDTVNSIHSVLLLAASSPLYLLMKKFKREPGRSQPNT
ncbi:MAG TPA: APC family permease [Terriglobales bacterium]|nr:APC family permease [Terriglobales bacterium]